MSSKLQLALSELNAIVTDAKASGKRLSDEELDLIEEINNSLNFKKEAISKKRIEARSKERKLDAKLDGFLESLKTVIANKNSGDEKSTESIIEAIKALKLDVKVDAPIVKVAAPIIPEIVVPKPEVKVSVSPPEVKVKVEAPIIPEPKVIMPKAIEIKKPKWFKFDSLINSLIKSIDGVKKSIDKFEFPKRAAKPISVRLSDGEKFYRALGGRGGGGGGILPFEGEDGKAKYPVVDDDGQLKVVQNSKVSIVNSTNTPLDPDEEWVGEWEDISLYPVVNLLVFADQASATDGIVLEWSTDAVTVHNTDPYTLVSSGSEIYRTHRNTKYLRVRYTNGSTIQTDFAIQAIYDRTGAIHSSHRAKDDITGNDDLGIVKNIIAVQTNDIETYKNVNVQNPLPIDGDSVYAKDLDLDASTIGTFTGDISTLFNDYLTEIVDITSTNPKTFTLRLQRPMVTTAFALASVTGNFSNVKILLKDAAGTTRLTIDESGDNTKYTARVFPISPTTFGTIVVEFHTADAVKISGAFAVKDVSVVARLRALKPDGTVTDIDATAGGNLKTSLEEFDDTFLVNPLPVRDPLLEIARGNLSGITHINKFGRAPSGIQVTNTDIWDRADAAPTQQIWTAPTQARIHAIVSNSDEDSDVGGVVAQGDGARTVRVFGLVDWDTNELSEDIVMDGTTAVNTSNSYVIIHRIEVLTKGSHVSGPNVGIITATAATDGTVTAQINAAQGQTQMAIYGIPSTQIAYLTKYYLSLHEAGAIPSATLTVDIELLVNPEPDAELLNFLIKHTQGVNNLSTAYLPHDFKPYLKIAGPAIIKLHATSSDADTEASGGYDLILVDN